LFIYRRRDRSDERPLLDAELMALKEMNITAINFLSRNISSFFKVIFFKAFSGIFSSFLGRVE